MLNDNYICGLEIEWDKLARSSYVKRIPALQNVTQLTFDSPITCFVGENGTGKSTLLEAIAVAYGMNPEGGGRNFNFSSKDTHSELSDAIRLNKGYRRVRDTFFLRAESFYNVASKAEEYAAEGDAQQFYQSYGGKSLHEQSHGESFLSLITSRFRPNALYLLDEPEAALSPQRQLIVLSEIYRLAKQNTQFIIASHSPILLGLPGAKILQFDEKGLRPVEYMDTESYQITEMFVNHREYFLDKLL